MQRFCLELVRWHDSTPEAAVRSTNETKILPHQTLIGSVLHKFVSGFLKESTK